MVKPSREWDLAMAQNVSREGLAVSAFRVE